MHRRLSFVSSSLFLLASCLVPVSAEDAAPATTMAPFPSDTRWAAIGDSITHAGWYIHFVHFYYMTRFPKQNLTLFDRGCNGDAAWQIPARYPYDITPIHPTVATIMLGMNDGGLVFYTTPPEKANWPEPLPQLKQKAIAGYEKSLRALVQKLLADKINVIVLTPSPYDDTVKASTVNGVGYNAALVEIAKLAEKVAHEERVPVVDFNGPMNKINLEHQAKDPAFSIVGSFRIHPGPKGHLIMAYLFLKAQNVPVDVARFSIKGTDGTVAHANNCQIDQAKVANGTLTFQYSANAIPFAVEHWYRDTLKWVPFAQDLNQEVFQVTDLQPGNYDVQIDGKTVLTCTAAELSEGVNLAENDKTPEYQQSAKVWHIYQQQFDNYSKLRDVVTQERAVVDKKIPRPLTLEQLNPILDAMLAAHTGKPDETKIKKQVDDLRELKTKAPEMQSQIDKALEEARAAAQPVPHTVTIAPATATAATETPKA